MMDERGGVSRGVSIENKDSAHAERLLHILPDPLVTHVLALWEGAVEMEGSRVWLCFMIAC